MLNVLQGYGDLAADNARRLHLMTEAMNSPMPIARPSSAIPRAWRRLLSTGRSSPTAGAWSRVAWRMTSQLRANKPAKPLARPN
jgi:hypothetical protein